MKRNSGKKPVRRNSQGKRKSPSKRTPHDIFSPSRPRTPRSPRKNVFSPTRPRTPSSPRKRTRGTPPKKLSF